VQSCRGELCRDITTEVAIYDGVQYGGRLRQGLVPVPISYNLNTDRRALVLFWAGIWETFVS
jgi:hypothetical protein